MKKLSAIFLAFFFALSLSSCGHQERYIYTETDRNFKSQLDNPNLCLFYMPGMEMNTGMADLIAEIEITSNQTAVDGELDDGIPYPMVWYRAKIREIWYGEVNSKEIKIWFAGEGPLLHSGDRLVAYLNYGDVENYYVPVLGEYSVYVLNPPDNGIFTFVLNEEYEDLSGQSEEVLRAETEQVLEDIRDTGGKMSAFLYGEIARPYYEQAVRDGKVSE